ncbi:MAG: hypothetical protein FWG12_04405 [Holophagaceae bacterium]|nr:hypothetical protein [Holophagaceae bacterium]
MLLFRVPIAWAASAMTYQWIGRKLQIFRLWASGVQMTTREPLTELAEYFGGLSPDLHDSFIRLGQLPELPPLSSAWPWLGIFSFFCIIGLWMHNVAWDHAALWMLGGTREEQSFRHSCVAVAEAMGAASYGSLLGFAPILPQVGLLAVPAVTAANIYYWGLRGIGLSAYHGCPVWKGIVATILHLLLATIFYGLLILVSVAVAMVIASSG